MPRVEALPSNTTFYEDIVNFTGKIELRYDSKKIISEYRLIEKTPRPDFSITLLWIAANKAQVYADISGDLVSQKYFYSKIQRLTKTLRRLEELDSLR